MAPKKKKPEEPKQLTPSELMELIQDGKAGDINRYRELYPNHLPSFSGPWKGVALEGADLKGFNLTGVIFVNCHFRRCNFEDTGVRNAHFPDVVVNSGTFFTDCPGTEGFDENTPRVFVVDSIKNREFAANVVRTQQPSLTAFRSNYSTKR